MKIGPATEREQALRVDCPYCRALAGDPCVTLMRTINREGDPHTVRIDAARRALRQQAAAQQRALL